MAKELPYFQFEPAEYLTRDVSFCSLSAQGLFTNLCSYYWQRGCKLTKTQFLRRLNHPDEFQELVDEGVIDLENENINIKFLDIQFKNATKLSEINSLNGKKGGRPRKGKTELKANQKPNESESKGIREEEIREDNNSLKENSESEVEEIKTEPEDEQVKKLKYNNETEFLADWNDARERILNKKSNINKLTGFELTDFRQLIKEFTISDFKNGIRGLMMQKGIFSSSTLRPKHFLSGRNIEKYIDAFDNKTHIYEDKKQQSRL